MKIIEAMHFGKPTVTKGRLYLMLTPYHWLVTSNTARQQLVRRYSIVQVKSRDRNVNHSIPVFVTNTVNGKRAEALKRHLANVQHPLKPVINGEPNLNVSHNHLTITRANLTHLSAMLAALHSEYLTNLNIKMAAKRNEPLSRLVLLNDSEDHKITTTYTPCAKKYAWWRSY